MDTLQVKETWKQKFFSTKGRINRLNYLLGSIALQLIASVAQFMSITALTLMGMDSAIIGGLLLLLIVALVLACICSGICLTIKRWHDLNKSGWYTLLCILIIPAIYIIFAKGTDGPNNYGPKPTSDN
ncbi:MAG: DUF805 domain-containing protein [Phascolarctobacterium sp.]|nr:DUF805 domain-containing protein [Phascolarctobacterium sp.]